MMRVQISNLQELKRNDQQKLMEIDKLNSDRIVLSKIASELRHSNKQLEGEQEQFILKVKKLEVTKHWLKLINQKSGKEKTNEVKKLLAHQKDLMMKSEAKDNELSEARREIIYLKEELNELQSNLSEEVHNNEVEETKNQEIIEKLKKQV